MALQEVEVGPIDVLIIGFPPGAAMTGEAMPIFFGLVDRRIIRVLDVQFVTKDREGMYESIDPADLDVSRVGDVADFAGAASGLLSDADIALVGSEIEPGGAAVMIAYENRWAAPLVTAVRRNGGVLITDERVHTQDLVDALDRTERPTEETHATTGLLRGIAHTGAGAGAATAVCNRVSRHQYNRWGAQEAPRQGYQAYEPPSQHDALPLATAPVDDHVSQLTGLAELKTQGILTDAEFVAEKARILAR